MRIIGGQAKGRKLHFPSGLKQRPTSDFLRETLFNLLGPLSGKTFLDLYAGSGSVGLEAASRGASKVFLVEKDRKIAQIAKENATLLGLGELCSIIAMDVNAGLNKLYKDECRFDIIFADPPYGRDLAGRTIELLKSKPVFLPKAVVVIQHSAREDIKLFLNERALLVEQRKYGDSMLTFLEME